MQILLLAAGMGLRLGPLTRTNPKALVRLKDKVLVDYALEALLKKDQVEKIVVVGGFAFELLKEHLDKNFSTYSSKIQLVQNPHFTWGNFYSVKSALPYLQQNFLILNVDHLFEEEAWDFFLSPQEEMQIFCDFERDFLDDEMKVRLKPSGHLESMSKTYPDYAGAYVGVTYVPQAKKAAYEKAAQAVEAQRGEKAVAEEVLNQMVIQGLPVEVRAFDAFKWLEVDTGEDLSRAKINLASLFPAKVEERQNPFYYRK